MASGATGAEDSVAITPLPFTAGKAATWTPSTFQILKPPANTFANGNTAVGLSPYFYCNTTDSLGVNVFSPDLMSNREKSAVKGGIAEMAGKILRECLAIAVKNPRIQQFVFQLIPAAVVIGDDQIFLGIGRLGILVEIFHVGVGRRAVEVEVIFLHVLAVVAFAVAESKQPLFEDGIVAIPECQGKAEDLVVVRRR